MAKKAATNANETLKGIVTPIQWDDDGNVSTVALFATDDEEYLIENGEKFIDLIQTPIAATGRVKREKKSFKRIFIKRFEMLEEY
jgi:hypothetical protein